MERVRPDWLADWPRQAKWLAAEEREWLAAELEIEGAHKAATRISLLQALRQRDVLQRFANSPGPCTPSAAG